MTESISQILKDSKQEKKKYLRWVIPLILIGVSAGIYFWYTDDVSETKPYVPEIYEVKKDDISSTVTSDGNIINPDIANLSFLINGTLKKLLVEEGNKVEEGQLLAELDKQDLNFDVKSAQNDVNIAWQNIKAKQADITDLDIINAQNDYEINEKKSESSRLSAEQNLTSTQTSTQAKKKSAQQNLDQAFVEAKLTIESAFSSIEETLQEVDYIFGIERNYSGKTISRLAFNDSIRETQIKNLYKELETELKTTKDTYLEKKQTMEQADISRTVWNLETLTKKLESLLDIVVTVFQSASSHEGISETNISSNLATIQNYQAKTQNLNSSLSSAKQNIDTKFLNLKNTFVEITNSLDSAQINLENTLSDIENNLKSAELKVKNAEKTVNKSNISKQTSLSIQYAQLEQSKLRVEKSKYELSLADLKAPKAGTIIEINGSVGESLKSDTTSSDTAFIKILSDANFTTEVYVEEIDIAQIHIDQKAKITLDAVPDSILDGKVSYIASTATTDNNGIVTYLVRIDIVETKDTPIREGMTTYVDFVTGEALDVLVVPSKAIVRNRFVLNENGERIKVEIGFSDGDLTEIKSGLVAGDKIISNPQTENTEQNGNQQGSGSKREMTPERLEQMKAAGFTDEEIQKLQNGEFTDEMREKMQKSRESNNGSSALGGGTGRGGGGGQPH